MIKALRSKGVAHIASNHPFERERNGAVCYLNDYDQQAVCAAFVGDLLGKKKGDILEWHQIKRSPLAGNR